MVTDLQVLNEKIEQVEAICLLYDTSAEESFRFAADLYVSLYHIIRCPVCIMFHQSSIKNLTTTHLPCLFVGTKVDCPQVAQNYHKQPKDLIEENKLLPAKVNLEDVISTLLKFTLYAVFLSQVTGELQCRVY